MKILIRNKKWETSFEKVKLICEVTIKTNNLDNTFKYLENIFNSSLENDSYLKEKMVI